MTTVSFVVPTRNAERTITACLRSLRLQAIASTHCDRVEVILVDNHSSDRTVELGAPYADRVVIAGPERCAQRNIGARCAVGDILVFIDADMVLEPTVAAEAAAAIVVDGADLVVLPELAFGENFFARCRSIEKRLYLGDETVEAGRAIRRSSFEAVGGWDETLTAGEDWDLTDRLRRHGAVVGRTSAHVWHDEGTVRLLTQFRKKRYYGVWVAAYLSRSGSARHLARTSLFRQPAVLARQPAHSVGLVALKLVEALGLATGMAQGRFAVLGGTDR